MILTGHSIIAGQPIVGEADATFGYDPVSNVQLEPAYSLLTSAQLKEATAQAADAFDSFRALDPEIHATFLECIAENIEAISVNLITRAALETGLAHTRLKGELARTTGQLRLFANVVRNGNFRGVRIDPALPSRLPFPRPDIRQRQIPLGPVGVFGASNFPIAFSTAGGDTAAALAAGCPVVFKAHNAHPGTGELVGYAITKAVTDNKLHPGVFSLVYGPGSNIGQALVSDPAIKAVAFTGSQSGGIALMRAAAARPEPIPVYAEMSSLNPVFVLPGALKGEVDTLAQQYTTAVTGSSGQLCTSPGLLFVPVGDAGDRLTASIGRAISVSTGQTMLTESIASAWATGTGALGAANNVSVIGRGKYGKSLNAPSPTIYGTTVADFISNSVLHTEIFGAASLVIRYSTTEELLDAVNRLEGQLTASLQLDDADYPTAAQLLPVLERKVGRVIVNGWPTGVEVGHAMVHGGPFPATSDTQSTSVGSLSIKRFLRPVAYQNFPQELLPAPLQDTDPWHLNRKINGVTTPQSTLAD